MGPNIKTDLENKNKETDLKRGTRKVGILNCRPALSKKVGVVKIKVPVDLVGKARLDMMLTAEPSTPQ